MEFSFKLYKKKKSFSESLTYYIDLIQTKKMPNSESVWIIL